MARLTLDIVVMVEETAVDTPGNSKWPGLFLRCDWASGKAGTPRPKTRCLLAPPSGVTSVA